MRYAGIDVGKKGAIAVLDRLGVIIYNMPKDYFSLSALFEIEAQRGKITVFLERQHAFPRQGVVSVFNLGEQFGVIQGLLIAYKIPYEIVNPTKWKNYFGITDRDKKERKLKAISLAQRLFPSVANAITNDGIAEALLIAEYGKRRSQGKIK